jgi:hypothetical protein
MIKLSENHIRLDEKISHITAIVIYNNEEIILTDIDIITFNHKIKTHIIDNTQVWAIRYFKDDDYFNKALQRYVLFEKTHDRYVWFVWQYNFYEPIEIIGKGSEIQKYEKLFLEIKENGGTFVPERTLLLRRKR